MLEPHTRTATPAALLRAVVVALLTCLAVGGTLATAASAAEGDVTWTVRTAANTYGPDRTSFTYTIDPGRSIDDAMVVANRGDEPLTFAVYGSDGYTTDSGQFDVLTADTASTGVGAWLTTPSTQVTVEPGAETEIPFSIAVPDTATPGDYAGAIVTSLARDDSSQQITVDRRLGVRINLRVSGEITPGLAIENVGVSYSGSLNPVGTGDATVTFTLHNTGNAIMSGLPEVALAGPFGLATVHADAIAAPPSLLPGERWTVSVPVGGVAPLVRLTATVTVTPLVTDASGSTTPIAPVTAKGSGWAVSWSLAGVLLVLVAGIVAWVLLARRARKRRSAAEAARVEAAVAQALVERGAGAAPEATADPAPEATADPAPEAAADPAPVSSR